MKKLLSLLRKTERLAYPPAYRQMQDVRSMADLACYMDCSIDEILIETGSTWYILVADRRDDDMEIVDFASSTRSIDGGELTALIARLLPRLAGRTVTMDARETTSYPIVQRLARHGMISIISDEPWSWDGETFHDLVVEVSS
jgi:hypothetical protein